MKILFLSTWYPFPPNNGSKIRAYHLLKALGANHDVTVVAFHPQDDGPALHSNLTRVVAYPVEADPYRYVRLPQCIKYISPVPLAFWPSEAMRKATARIATEEHWDAIVAYEPPVARHALGWADTPRVLEIDTSLAFQMHERYVQSSALFARVRAWASWKKAYEYERRLFSKFQVCTVAAQQEVRFVEQMVDGTQAHVRLLSNGVDCLRNRPVYKAIDNTLIYNGALTYSANYDAMQYFTKDILPLIRQSVADVTLTITGSTTGVDLRGLALDGSVRLSGYVEDIRPVVGSASICVVPLRQGSGTRVKILEAMALGVPVISTRKGSEGLEAVDGEHLVLADTPAAFAEATVHLLQHPDVRQGLAARARKLVEERYDWAQIGEQFVKLVEDIVAARAKERRSVRV